MALAFALQCFLSTLVRALTSDAFVRSVLLANRETAPPEAIPEGEGPMYGVIANDTGIAAGVVSLPYL